MSASHGSTHAPAVAQVPATSQVSRLLLTHRVLPGAQEPTHDPETQAWFTQGTRGAQIPPSTQRSTPLPSHSTCPGMQISVHPPLTHVPLHGTGAPHAPM